MESPVAVDQQPAPPEPPAPGGPRATPAQRVLTTVGLVALAASAVLGGNLFGARERFFASEKREAKAPAASREADGATATTAPSQRTLVRSQPWWQKVTTLEGAGSTVTAGFTIADDALQWRVRGVCDSGRLVVEEPGRPKPLVDGPCAGNGTAQGFSSKPGTRKLQVTASGPWRLEVEQQVDVPLEEPPLASMTAPGAVLVARGSLYRMDQTGTGTLLVYRLADGTYALRLDRFFVTANIDLEIRLSPHPEPRTTADYLSAPAALAAPLDITAGSLNFVVPKGIDPTRYKSVVIWCPLITSAYAGAVLEPVA